MTAYVTLMRRAGSLRRLEDDGVRHAWWTGYLRGLRRAHHGGGFGTDAEHALFFSAVDSDDPTRAALGRGYRAGLTLTACDPE